MQGHEPDEIMWPILWTEWLTGAMEGLATHKERTIENFHHILVTSGTYCPNMVNSLKKSFV
jgi:hypothetical protein